MRNSCLPGSSRSPFPTCLQPGHVVTCEPGIYFDNDRLQKAFGDSTKKQFLNEAVVNKYKGCGGIRIADHILILEQGNQNLTTAAGMVKSVDDIEALCK